MNTFAGLVTSSHTVGNYLTPVKDDDDDDDQEVDDNELCLLYNI